MRIAVFEIEDWERDAFAALWRAHEIAFVTEPLSASNAARHHDAEIVSTFIYSDLSAQVLEHLARVLLIATRSTGFDHIDTGYCRQRGIAIANVPSYGKRTVAEHTFALLLAISHHIVDGVDRARRGSFSLEGLEGFDLRGRTLGVVGTGEIGAEVARIAAGFQMRVLAYDVKRDDLLIREVGVHYVTLETLLERSDVVTLHLPLNDKTRRLIGGIL